MPRDSSARDLDPLRTITVVSGLPRSGTSMLMQMLASAGLEIATDGRRVADDDNPKGYYELEAVRRIRVDTSFLDACVGRVVKIVAPLLTALPDDFDYRVLFMERDLREILASQAAMLRRQEGEGEGPGDAALARAYRARLETVRVWLGEQPHIKWLLVSHRRALEAPKGVASEVVDFLDATGSPANVHRPRPRDDARVVAMSNVVERSLWRQGSGTA